MATWCSPVRCETAEAPLEIARISRENWLKLLARHRTPGALPPLLLRASEPLGAEAIVEATATFVIVAAEGLILGCDLSDGTQVAIMRRGSAIDLPGDWPEPATERRTDHAEARHREVGAVLANSAAATRQDRPKSSAAEVRVSPESVWRPGLLRSGTGRTEPARASSRSPATIRARGARPAEPNGVRRLLHSRSRAPAGIARSDGSRTLGGGARPRLGVYLARLSRVDGSRVDQSSGDTISRSGGLTSHTESGATTPHSGC